MRRARVALRTHETPNPRLHWTKALRQMPSGGGVKAAGAQRRRGGRKRRRKEIKRAIGNVSSRSNLAI